MRYEAAAAAVVAELLDALCEESEALKSGDPARLAAAQGRKRAWLRLLSADESGRILCARRKP